MHSLHNLTDALTISRLCKLQKSVQPQVISLPVAAHGRWFSPSTSASSTTKTGRHDIAESGVKHTKDQSGIVISFMLY
jgi:hypothetical protein